MAAKSAEAEALRAEILKLSEKITHKIEKDPDTDHLKKIVATFPQQIESLQKQVNTLQEKVNELNEKKDTINDKLRDIKKETTKELIQEVLKHNVEAYARFERGPDGKLEPVKELKLVSSKDLEEILNAGKEPVTFDEKLEHNRGFAEKLLELRNEITNEIKQDIAEIKQDISKVLARGDNVVDEMNMNFKLDGDDAEFSPSDFLKSLKRNNEGGLNKAFAKIAEAKIEAKAKHIADTLDIREELYPNTDNLEIAKNMITQLNGVLHNAKAQLNKLEPLNKPEDNDKQEYEPPRLR